MCTQAQRLEIQDGAERERFFISSQPIKLMLNDFYLTIGSHLLLPIVACLIAGDAGFPVVSPTCLN